MNYVNTICYDIIDHIMSYLHPIYKLIMSSTCTDLLRLRETYNKDFAIPDIIDPNEITDITNIVVLTAKLEYVGISRDEYSAYILYEDEIYNNIYLSTCDTQGSICTEESQQTEHFTHMISALNKYDIWY